MSDDGCDCAHVLLSHDARIVRRMRVGDDTQTIAPHWAAIVSTVGAEVPAPALVAFGLTRPDPMSLPLSERAPFVLRC
jgi:hypothetical protein